MIDVVIANMQILTLKEDYWWTGVVWIIVMFLKCT